MRRFLLHFLIAAVYLLLAVAAHYYDMPTALFYLTLPLSWLVVLVGWIVIHTSTVSIEFLMLACACVNAMAYLLLVFRYDLRPETSKPR